MSSGPFEIVHRCPGCGAGAIVLAYLPNLWRCRCGLYFENPRPHPSKILGYYERGAPYERYRREEKAREALWEKRLGLVLRFRSSGRLLDVGTGDGHFLRCARRHFAAEGTEVSRAGIRLALEHRLQVRHGRLEELSLEEGTYDVVTLWHVLEHLPCPAEELARIRRLLRPGGHLFVGVPNETRILDLQKLRRRRQSPFMPIRAGDEIHLLHFTPWALEGLLRREGFRVIRMGADDVDTERSVRSRTLELLWRLCGAAVGRRWCTAVYAVCRPDALEE